MTVENNRFITEIPERWLIVKVIGGYKVFGTWAGGYLDGDRWKMNSGIAKVEQDEDNYYFHGFSGSCYKCHKKGYGVATSYGQGILDRLMEIGQGRVEILEDTDDWSKLITNE